MIDRTRISGFDWDGGNARKEAEQAFFNAPLLVVPDVRHSDREPRFHGLGQTDQGRRLHVTFTLRKDGTLVRVISARDMSRKEREFYGKAESTESSD